MAIEIITTVLTPAASYDLTDLATVKDELSLPTADTSKDCFLSRGITQVSAAIARYCNRVFPAETVSDLIYLRGRPFSPHYAVTPLGQPAPLQLTRWPVVSMTSVIETAADGTTTTLLEDTDYQLDPATGWLFRLDCTSGMLRNWFTASVTAQYEAGYAAIPDDVVDACLRLVTLRFKARGRDPSLMEQTTQELGTQRFWVGPAPGQNGAMPPEIEALVDRYRVPVAG